MGVGVNSVHCTDCTTQTGIELVLASWRRVDNRHVQVDQQMLSWEHRGVALTRMRTACTTSKPPGGQGSQEMASLREIGEMETKTRQKWQNYDIINHRIYTKALIRTQLTKWRIKFSWDSWNYLSLILNRCLSVHHIHTISTYHAVSTLEISQIGFISNVKNSQGEAINKSLL